MLNPGRADAVLTYNIFQDGLDVVVKASGSLVLPDTTCCISNPNSAGIFTTFGNLVTGSTSNQFPIYSITGPALIPAPSLVLVNASSFSGANTLLQAGAPFGIFGISSYISGTEINSSATFNSNTLANLGFTTTGPIGTWTIVGPPFETGATPTPFDTINLVVGPPVVGPPASVSAVPGPLPLIGVAAAFRLSRRLRRRIATANTTAAG
ncbi:MAG: hypothetical protein ACKO22_02975 [Cyanobium sp.]